MNPLEHRQVSNCGFTKILQATVHDGCPSQLASKLLKGGQHKCQYLCEYSTNCKYFGIMGLLLNIPIRGCITLRGLVLSLQLQIENKNYLSNILTVSSYRGIYALQHKHNNVEFSLHVY